MVLVKLILVLRYLLRLGPPTALDEASVRKWLGVLVGFLKDLAKATETTIDDDSLALLDGIVQNDPQWQAFWRLVGAILPADGKCGVLGPDGEHVLIVPADTVAAFDPAWIELALAVVKMLLDFWNSRK